MQKAKKIRTCSDMRAHLVDREQDSIETSEIESVGPPVTLDIESLSLDEQKELLVTAA